MSTPTGQVNGNGHAAPAATDIPAPSSTGKIQPNDVGWQFVPQYYKFVNKEPHRLHLFYTKRSSFVHGEEGDDEAEVAHGQQEIHERINAIGYDQCKVYVHSIDSQSSAGGGIIIQVIGEMSNANGPWRKFAQTFFLAEQPNGYFVLNDIFRYLKEEVDFDEEETLDGEVVSTSAGSAPTPAPAVVPIPAEAPAQPEPTPAPVEVEPTPEPQPEAAAPTPEPISAPSGPVTDAVPIEAVAAAVPDKDVAPAEAPAVEVPAAVVEAATPAAVEEAAPAPVAETKAPASAPNGTAAAAPAPTPAPAAPAAPAKPKSWASLAASGKAWGTPVTPTATAPAPAPAAAAPAAAPKKPEAAAAPAPAAPAATPSGQPRHPAYESALKYNGIACFVKLPNWQPDSQAQPSAEVIDEPFLKQIASRFGEVKKVEIVKDKACAFVEFTASAFARKAIIASLNVNQGGEGGVITDAGRIAFESRKEKDERGPSKGGRRGEPGQRTGGGGGGQRGGASGGGSRVSSGAGGEHDRGGPSGRGGRGGRGRGGASGGGSGDRTPANK